MTALVSSGRVFQVWGMTVSHGQLLLRSNRNDDEQTRKEILFKGVGALKLRTRCDGLIVRIATTNEAAAIREEVDLTEDDGRNCFVLESDGWRGFVIALSAFESEDDGDYADPSALFTKGSGVSLFGERLTNEGI